MSKKSNLAVLPVLFSFFIMGFADVVGISSSYVKQDFGLSDSMANLLPMMVFLWFAVFSVPTGVLMNKLGRKNTVLLSTVVTLLALLVPLASYSYSMVLIAFALLGIGNTILQVALNPLLTNVVSGEKLTSSLTLGQFVKAIASFIGPIVAGVASGTFGNWKLIFPFFAAITLLSGLWLLLAPIQKEQSNSETAGFAASFKLLKDPVVLSFFFAIVVLVGIDVGLNVTFPKFLMERTVMPLEKAGLATSLYFAARTIGTFIGAILLMKYSGRLFYIGSAVLGIVALVVVVAIPGPVSLMYVMIFCSGLAVANVFSIVFSAALRRKPEYANEVSGLLIMGVAGGAIVPPIMGMVSDAAGQTGAMVVVLLLFVYLLINALKMK
ncbi:MFS transporter [uncultured Draconibacterium sp.]|uniref:MFS transporter n=1 Tax=uncultured Draconibacterium sp. TaxID=1573823 RepID=UPI002AA7505C|nr:MFS transporter [uncultured Draconibacterium sp.]